MNPTPLPYRFLTAILFAGMFAVAAIAAEQFYTCGMHPQIIKKEPGNCPICGMALTPVRANAGGASSGERKIEYYKSTMIPGEVSQQPGKDSMGMDMVPVYSDAGSTANAIHIDTGTIQRMNLKTGTVTRGPVSREIRNVGTVAYNEKGLRDITTKYEGWLEKLHVDATWTTVKAGDPLFEIYSPDLYNAQLNYLVALRTEGETGGPLTRAALARLRLFDVDERFLNEIARTGEARRTFTYRAPSDGVVIEKMAVAGQMMKPGERIYRIADLSTVWVLAQVFESDLALVHEGQSATVRTTYGGQREFPATIELLLPRVEEQTRSATVRLVLHNPDGFLRPGMFVDVRISTRVAESAVLVPEIAVLRSGERNTVFLANPDGTFVAREVKLGARNHDGRYEVLEGLAEGDRIVTSGQFMLDSESQLREAIQKMIKFSTAAAEDASAQSRAGLPGAPEPSSEGGRPATEGGSETRPTSDPAAIATLTTLALALADAAASLAADDLPAYKRQLPALREAVAAYFKSDEHAGHGPLAKFKDGPPEPADLEAAQNNFAAFSTAVTDLARANHIHHRESLHVFECPMAPQVGKGRWLQRDSELKNPFFGSRMLTCGEEIQ